MKKIKLSIFCMFFFINFFYFFSNLTPAAQKNIAPESVTPVLEKLPTTSQKCLYLHNTHTNEIFRECYTDKKGVHNPKVLEKINYILRDHRTHEVYPIDPCLLDLLYDVVISLKSGKNPLTMQIDVVSGYRSPKSNNALRLKDKGVSKNSLHVQGRAIDFRIKDVPLKKLRDAAKALKRGGVGYYPGSQFIHIDNGRARCWGPQK